MARTPVTADTLGVDVGRRTSRARPAAGAAPGTCDLGHGHGRDPDHTTNTRE